MKCIYDLKHAKFDKNFSAVLRRKLWNIYRFDRVEYLRGLFPWSKIFTDKSPLLRIPLHITIYSTTPLIIIKYNVAALGKSRIRKITLFQCITYLCFYAISFETGKCFLKFIMTKFRQHYVLIKNMALKMGSKNFTT